MTRAAPRSPLVGCWACVLFLLWWWSGVGGRDTTIVSQEFFDDEGCAKIAIGGLLGVGPHQERDRCVAGGRAAPRSPLLACYHVGTRQRVSRFLLHVWRCGCWGARAQQPGRGPRYISFIGLSFIHYICY